VQTDWTDGSASIEVMAEAAYAAGLAYIAITDHTKRLAMTHGLDEKRLLLQGKEIERVNEKFKKERKQFRILKGTECDILKDGSLDLKDKVLKTLDMVGISVHSHFDLPEKEQTERIIRAMQNPYVTILFHPTGRRIGKRPPYALNMEAIIKEAKKRDIILEANASPERLDLQGDHIRMAIQAGVRIAVNSDAHDPSHFGFLRYGIAQARRGWATKKDVVNTASFEKFLKR
jgi:DNA polymerase (family 10)